MASTSELLGKYKFKEESFEMFKGNFVKTGYPKPLCHFRFIWEAQNVSMENAYFWVTTSMRNDGSYNELVKISDAFAASQSSSFFGATQARLGVTQDRASGLFAQIGKLVKDLFQMVRELRVLKQKLDYYNNSYAGDKTAEIVLKGIWVDQVEGGTKNPASVYGMAREVGFVTLPDLFFSTHPGKKEKVGGVVDKLEFNRKVREVLKRKIYAYLDWKEKTFEELKTRNKFTLKYLRQHYNVIRMYMAWVKPYLKYTKLLSMNPDQLKNPDLVSAFEGSLLEVEVMGKRKFGSHYSILSAQFNYRTSPTMPYHQDEYRHKGPLHVGKVEFNLRAYSWTQEQLDNYLKVRDEEDFELLGSINDSIKAAIDALGSDLKGFLKDSGEFVEEDKKLEKKKSAIPGGLDPFVSIFKGFGELAGAFLPRKVPKNKSKKAAPLIHPLKFKSNAASAGKHAKGTTWAIFKNFKKAHKFMAW
ncbi:MAG: hypothetical protein U9R08_02255 [Nanoarchaeota archaeon]|nr:hypothetical protein [Nanoarchaeota archaeon]